MQSVNKIHINSSTKLSLNDRFSSLHSIAAPAKIAVRRNAQVTTVRPVVDKASIRNRNLLAQLDHKHKVRAAMKIKRKSLRPNTRVAGTQRGSIGGGRGRPTAAVLKRNHLASAPTAAAAARLRRAQNIAIMGSVAERQPRGASINRRRRSVSSNRPNLSARLGVNAASPQAQQQAPRRRLNRNSLVDLTRPNSRSRSLVRNNHSQARSGSRAREPSAQRGGRSASRNRRPVAAVQPNAVQQRRPSVPAGRPVRQQNAAAKARRMPATSVRSRLGINGQKAAGQGARQRALTGVASGRVQKRRASVSRKEAARPLKNIAKVNPAQRQVQARGRSQSRNRQTAAVTANQRPVGKPNNRNVSQSNRSRAGKALPNARARKPLANGRAGKALPNAKAGGARVAVRGRKATTQGKRPKAPAQTPKTREQLDNELDQYMVNRSDM